MLNGSRKGVGGHMKSDRSSMYRIELPLTVIFEKAAKGVVDDEITYSIYGAEGEVER